MCMCSCPVSHYVMPGTGNQSIDQHVQWKLARSGGVPFKAVDQARATGCFFLTIVQTPGLFCSAQPATASSPFLRSKNVLLTFAS